ncbi:zinc finger family protein [Striga asiatica]|uniref:Zinc finger family protein n=1 Tax=Striga asiatica TaxID=4170 RepID=A0A5A7PCQ9_STRAF|nr:zinc finger family protein [Striga asiatica]
MQGLQEDVRLPPGAQESQGCFASGPEFFDEDSGRDESGPSVSAWPANKLKVHECSVCCRVFASGQALGGHKRCHWLTSSAQNAYNIPGFQELQYEYEYDHGKPVFVPAPDRGCQLDLNLNLPAQEIEGRDGLETKKIRIRRMSDLRDANYVEGWLQIGGLHRLPNFDDYGRITEISLYIHTWTGYQSSTSCSSSPKLPPLVDECPKEGSLGMKVEGCMPITSPRGFPSVLCGELKESLKFPLQERVRRLCTANEPLSLAPLFEMLFMLAYLCMFRAD